MLSQTNQLRVAASLGLLGVILGALGAHGPVYETVLANGRVEAWQKAVFYLFVHTLMLFLLARSGNRKGPFLCFLAGVALFSGSLFLWGYTNLKWLPHVTPFGGICLMAGWLWLAVQPVVPHKMSLKG